MAFFSQSVFKIIPVIVLLCGLNTSVVLADDYLNLLEAEAEDVKLDQSGQLKEKEPINRGSTDGITKTNWKWEGDLVDDNLPTGLTQDELATVLKQNFYGTFVFYRRLNSVDKDTVYYHYTKSSTADIESIRDDILNHLKN
ncbi:MAG: hypothetical protein COA54_11450 [Thiotrichaceae bacterium]|nr:MAG: hypothetical protein COA54_11450 [Thiotrichaceae bacterium]